MISTIKSLVPVLSTAESILHETPSAAINIADDKRLITNQPQRFIQFVADMIGSEPWGNAYGMGMVNARGEIVCGVVFEDYNRASACIHVAGIGKYWLSRTFLYAVFDYAFNQLKLKRLTGLVAQGNDAAYNFDLHLGFKLEHVLKDAHPNGDIYLLVMRPEDCRYLPGARNGKE
ncbi:GNAT family N-acetyltransferase [Undibacterium sp. Rencai35W]